MTGTRLQCLFAVALVQVIVWFAVWLLHDSLSSAKLDSASKFTGSSSPEAIGIIPGGQSAASIPTALAPIVRDDLQTAIRQAWADVPVQSLRSNGKSKASRDGAAAARSGAVKVACDGDRRAATAGVGAEAVAPSLKPAAAATVARPLRFAVYNAYPYHTEVFGAFIDWYAHRSGDHGAGAGGGTVGQAAATSGDHDGGRGQGHGAAAVTPSTPGPGPGPGCYLYTHDAAVDGTDTKSALPLYASVYPGVCVVRRTSEFTSDNAQEPFELIISLTAGKSTGALQPLTSDTSTRDRIVHVVHHYDKSFGSQPWPWETRVLFLTPLVGKPAFLPIFTRWTAADPVQPSMSSAPLPFASRARRIIAIGNGAADNNRYDVTDAQAFISGTAGLNAVYISNFDRAAEVAAGHPSIAVRKGGQVSVTELFTLVRSSLFVLINVRPGAREATTRMTGALPLALSLGTPMIMPRHFADVYCFSSADALIYENSLSELRPFLDTLLATATDADAGTEYDKLLEGLTAFRSRVVDANDAILERHVSSRDWSGVEWTSWKG